MHIFLTGGIQVGKSTIIKAVIDSQNNKETGGFFTRWINKNNVSNAGLYIFPADQETISLLWDINTMENPDSVAKLQKYLTDDNLIASFDSGNYKKKIINKSVFDELGRDYVDAALSSDLAIIDEIGIFEENAYDFKEGMDALLESNVPTLGTVRAKTGILIEMIKSHPNVEVIEVTRENREDVRKDLIKKFKNI